MNQALTGIDSTLGISTEVVLTFTDDGLVLLYTDRNLSNFAPYSKISKYMPFFTESDGKSKVIIFMKPGSVLCNVEFPEAEGDASVKKIQTILEEKVR